MSATPVLVIQPQIAEKSAQSKRASIERRARLLDCSDVLMEYIDALETRIATLERLSKPGRGSPKWSRENDTRCRRHHSMAGARIIGTVFESMPLFHTLVFLLFRLS